jgi:four helix bundle protein
MSDTKPYNLEERTLEFAEKAFKYVKGLPKGIANIELGKQLVRSAGSIGANYIEANEALGKKDFVMRIKISRKEAKETIYWLKLSEPDASQMAEKEYLLREAIELMSIFGAIYRKVE